MSTIDKEYLILCKQQAIVRGYIQRKKLSEQGVKVHAVGSFSSSLSSPSSWSRHSKSLFQKYVYDFSINIRGTPLMIQQDNVVAPQDLGNTIWDGCIVLSKYLTNPLVFPSSHWSGKRVVEVGSGTGLVGLACGVLGADVTVTDLPSQLPLLQANIDKNHLQERVKADVLSWGEGCSHLRPPVDVVVAAECIYYEELVIPLCHSLRELCDRHTVVYVSYEPHNPEGVSLFLETASKIFNIEQIPESDLDEAFRSEKIQVIQMKLL